MIELNETYYEPGTLYKNTINDENGVNTIEFKDTEGRVVLKRTIE